MGKKEDTYQVMKEFTHRDENGKDHFRYYVEKNGEWQHNTLCNSLEKANKHLDQMIAPQKPLPSKLEVMRTEIVEREDDDEKVDNDKEWKDKFDDKLSKVIGFDAKSLDNLDIRPNDKS